MESEPITKDKTDLVIEVSEAYKYHAEYREEQLKRYRADLLMRIGEQWDEDDIAELDKLKKPHLTFNHLGRMTDLLGGHERDQRRDVIAMPVGAEDKKGAAVATGAIKYIDTESRAHFEKSQAFDDCASMGEGILGFLFDADREQYRIAQEDVFMHVPDRDCRDMTWEKSSIHFRRRWMTKAQIRKEWPEKVEQVVEMLPYGHEVDSNGAMKWVGSNAYTGRATVGGSHVAYDGDYDLGGLDPSPVDTSSEGASLFYREKGRKYLVIECWQRVSMPTSVIYEKLAGGKRQKVEEVPWHIDNETGHIVEQSEKVEMAVEGMEHFEIQKTKAWKWRLTVVVGDIVLDDGITQYPRLPFVPYFWFRKFDGMKVHTHGFIRRLVDAQKAYNKGLSQELHAIGTSMGVIILLAKNLVRGIDPDTLKTAFANFNAIITFEGEAAKEGEQWSSIKPGEVPYQLFQANQKYREEIQLLSGLDSQSFMGQSDKGDPSGWAMEVKQRRQVLQIATPFDNVSESNIALYRDVVWPMLKNSEITLRVRREKRKLFGEENAGGPVLVNMPSENASPEELAAYGVEPGDSTILGDLSKVNVDIVFDEASMSPTERQRTLTMLSNMQKNGQVIPPEILFEFMDEPVVQKILDYMEAQAQNAAQEQAAGEQMPPDGMPMQ